MKRAGWLGAILPGLILSGCGDRQGSIDAAMALAEAVYPGQLELLDSHLKKGQYAVTMGIKGDPLTRIGFDIDPDPAHCRIGTRCEERLRRAYAAGVAAGVKMKVLNAVLPACGVRMLGVQESEITPAFRTIVELDLDPADPQPGLNRVTPCIAAYRAAMPADARDDHLAFRILLPNGAPAKSAPLTFERQLEGARNDEPSYMISVAPDAASLSASQLRLYAWFLSAPERRDRLADAARAALAAERRQGHVPRLAQFHGTRLDPRRLDVVRTYVLACSVRERGKGPCRTDMAVRLRYDLRTGATSEPAILHDIRDAKGQIVLPELPGR
ncbi:hypothetical protein [Sphingomonas sp. BK235]|uniref:hypothetical protein n=1 Tax=Sphingomonas sp. BK235 TaxID=2512131 RepID=UPI001045AAD1|nr:hypothetical protein [Sphingomonas sp. BK235]TCP36582.1 hypothetical protein EV292_10178 [Sphingomonas sp. BK235]